MTKIDYWHFEDESYEVLTNKKKYSYIKDKQNNKYYYKQDTSTESANQIEHMIGDYIFSVIITVTLLCYIFCFYQYFTTDLSEVGNANERIIQSLIFLLVNVIFHELGHALVMKYYGRKTGKVKFRMNFIFPTISVETSDSYMLPAFRRLFVYANGLVVNTILITLVTIFMPRYLYINSCVIMSILMNLLPIGIIRSDGYHIWINVLLHQNDYKREKSLIFIISQITFAVFAIIMGISTIYHLL